MSDHIELLDYAYPVFLVLPVATWLDVTNRIPSYVFYALWAVGCVVYAWRLVRSTERHSARNLASLGALLLISFSIAMILSDSLPGNIIDSLPSTPDTVWLASNVLAHGTLPAQGYSNAQYLSYPLSIIQLAELELTLGTTSSMLPKLLQVGLVLIPPMAIYGFLKDKRVGLIAATIGSLPPWILDAGTHYSPEAVGAVLLAVAISILIANLVQNEDKFRAGLLIMGVALTLTDVFYGFIWIVVILGLAVALVIWKRWSPKERTLAFLLAASGLSWGSWYLLGTGTLLVTKPFSEIASLLLNQISLNTTYLVSATTIPFFIRASEYAAYLSLGACAVLAALVYLRKAPVISATILAVVFVTLAVFLPWVAGYQSVTDLAQRAYYVFQLGAAIPVAYLLASASSSRRKFVLLGVVVVLAVLPWNALAYGGRPYQYSASFPYSNADTRFNLESWEGLGKMVCGYSHDPIVWGVRLGAAFVTCTTYATLSPDAAKPNGIISPDQLTDLGSVLGAGKLVALRMSLESSNEWVQPLPETPRQILSAYDVVFDSGDPVLLYTL